MWTADWGVVGLSHRFPPNSQEATSEPWAPALVVGRGTQWRQLGAVERLLGSEADLGPHVAPLSLGDPR